METIYIEFGEEWKAEMNKLTKSEIIDLFQKVGREKLNAEIELKKTEKRSAENYDKWVKLDQENYKLKKQNFSLMIDNVAEMKASKMLFKMVGKNYTHRQKQEMANLAQIVLNENIKEINTELAHNLAADLPF